MTIDKTLLSRVTEFAMRKYDGMDSTHGREHAEKTVRLALYIAGHEGADPVVCQLGALLHQYHPENAGLVDEFLRSIGLDPRRREEVVHCVQCVELDTIHLARTLEARVVFDADKLQTLGPFGLVREVAYRTTSLGADLREAVRAAMRLHQQVPKLLQTGTARRLASAASSIMEGVFQMIDEWDRLSFLGSGEVGLDSQLGAGRSPL